MTLEMAALAIAPICPFPRPSSPVSTFCTPLTMAWPNEFAEIDSLAE